MEEEKIRSAVIIEFDGPNDVRFVPRYVGKVHPGQIVWACEMLIVLAKQQMLESTISQQEKPKEDKILVPTTKFVTPEM